tara:strand:+ start:2219 stop:2404 length:186 start_codon:yes stop_codon:yes gene_type:complete
MKLKWGVFEIKAGFIDLTCPQISKRMEYIVASDVLRIFRVFRVFCWSGFPQIFTRSVKGCI